MPTVAPDRHKWLVVGVFWCVYFLNQADRQVVASVFPLLGQELGVSDTHLGLLGSSFFWVYGMLVPLAGGLGDMLSRKTLIALALLVWSAATFSSGLVSGFALLLAFRALTGAGEACYYPAAASIISDYHAQRTRALALSVHQTSVYFGIVASGALAGYIGQEYGWRVAFLVFGGIGMLFALVVGKAVREPARGQSDQLEMAAAGREGRLVLSWRARLCESFHTPTAVILMLAFVGMNFVNTACQTWMPTLLHRGFQLSLARAGFHATFYHYLGAFLGVLIGGRLADRWASRTRLSRPLVQAAGLLLGAPFIFLLGRGESASLVFASLALFGLFRGLYDSNLFASLYEVVRPEARATATGFMLAAAFLVGGSAPLAVGWISQRMGLGPALSATSFCYLGAALMLLLTCALWFRRDAERMRLAAFGPSARQGASTK